jgi:hypothetical protein
MGQRRDLGQRRDQRRDLYRPPSVPRALRIAARRGARKAIWFALSLISRKRERTMCTRHVYVLLLCVSQSAESTRLEVP